MVSEHGHYIAGNIHEPHGIRQVTGLSGFWVVVSLFCYVECVVIACRYA